MINPLFIELEKVLELHAMLVERYGGSQGVREMNLLLSALEMPKAGFGGEYLHRSLCEMAAAYVFHLAKNHPFVDGNKRTAFATMDVFLQMNGFDFLCTAEEAFDFILKVATGGFQSKEEIAKHIAIHTTPIVTSAA